MPTGTLNIETRINTINSVLGAEHSQIVGEALKSAHGNWPDALKDKLPEAELQRVTLVHTLADWSGDNVPVVTALANQPDLTNLRDVALNFNVDKLAALVDPNTIPASIAGTTPEEKRKNYAITLHNNLFTAEPSAVLQRMVRDAQVPIMDTSLRTGVASFLNNQPEFNIRTTSVYTAMSQPNAFNGIADELRAGIVDQLKTLQRVQAISPAPEAVPVLMNANLTSAFRVAEIPETTFLAAHGNALGEETARQVYTNAINVQVRNEHALMTMRDSVRGSGLAIIDGQQSREARLAAMQTVADQNAVPLNLESLFGSMDYCECNDCLSVYSPASYFVEILQYLRNNDLGPDSKDPSKPNPGIRKDPKDISNTPLEKLFRRRPDLGCLELTCENTFTVLPYIDLVNEVMESFVVHLDKYKNDPNVPKQATLETFNVLDETTSELLAQPQHVNYQAYCILKDAVYPFTLPYHQAIDVIRIWLKYLGSSRYELLDTFRTATENCSNASLTPAQQQQLNTLHTTVLDRSADAEFLGITQEEYIILTHEAFWPKAYFDLTAPPPVSDDDYRKKIGVHPVWEYYGYSTESEMLDLSEDPVKGQKGLTFVKKQFLPRTGIEYIDLVEMLKTRYINPAFPQGGALTILESIRFSYRFLQTLVDPDTSKSPQLRFAKLIGFLNGTQALIPAIEALLHPDPCHRHDPAHCVESIDFGNWVYCYFERIGKLIVLESGQGPELMVTIHYYRASINNQSGSVPLEGSLVDMNQNKLGLIHSDGSVFQTNGQRFAQINVDLSVSGADGNPLAGEFGVTVISNGVEMAAALIRNGRIQGIEPYSQISWRAVRDTCDLDIVRLTHLDGTPVLVDEYDRMQRFIRLWHKMGWSIDETGLALVGSSGLPAGAGGQGGGSLPLPAACNFVGFDTFQSDCPPDGGDGSCPVPAGPGSDADCPDLPPVAGAISTDFLHQLVAIRKLIDLTGLPLDKLLAFWADISTVGGKSLYARLFLTHNLQGIDKIFKPDTNGNFLAQGARISDHMPVLMAALKLKAEEVAAVISLRSLPDALTLTNVSILYRHALLAKILHVQVVDLSEIFALFNDPFKLPQDTITLLHDWGHMEDAGFSFRQLNYVIRDHDDVKRPMAPPQKTILQISKTLYDGLNAIDHDHPDITTDKKDDATADLIRTEAGLLYETTIVEKIIGLLEGTTVYTTNAPVDATIVIPDALAKKVKYSIQKDPSKPPAAAIQVTGILTDTEKTLAKTISSNAGWAPALDRVGKQAQQLFNDTISGIFSNTADAITHLLSGDINLPPDPNNPAATDANTAPLKRYYFLQYFLPFLRERLAHRLIVDTLAGTASLANDVTDSLLSDILWIGATKQAAIDVLKRIHLKPAASGNDWKGYLIPSADGLYTFIANSLVDDKQPPDMVIDGQTIAFTVQQLDPTNVWSTDPAIPIKLKSGKLYWIEISGQAATNLQWKTPVSPKSAIPASVLLPDYSSSGTGEVFVKLYKAALLVNGFTLTVDEVSYWQNHAADFDGFDFNTITLQHFRRLQAYTSLRDKLPKTDTSLLDLFQWATKPDAGTTLSNKIAAATQWNSTDITKLITPEHFNLNHAEAFRNEINLVKLQQALQVAGNIGADIDRLFNWANPISKFSVCHRIAEDIRASLRARYDQVDWEQVVKPLNDQLREDQKQALISYLVIQPDLRNWGVVDADSLFEFFLIDVQMDACMQTSRIKQGISSVQLFIQRCLLGLEDQYGVPSSVLDRDRWNWMQKYRVWEANRKVFLYPENWIKSELRDDKSPFYKELESELLQKDINTQTVEDALKNYLFKVDEVANLKVVGLFLEQSTDVNGHQVPIRLHVFGRTRNAPYFLFYRYFQAGSEKNWYPWQKVQVDVPSYDVEDANGKVIESGMYLIPFVWNKRLLLFFPQFTKKTAPSRIDPNTKFDDMRNQTMGAAKARVLWEIKMAWSEYRNGKWTQKQLSSDALTTSDDSDIIPPIAAYNFVPSDVGDSINIGVLRIDPPDALSIGAFYFLGSKLRTGDPLAPLGDPPLTTDFQYVSVTPPPQTPSAQVSRIYSLQTIGNAAPPLFNQAPYFEDTIDNDNLDSETVELEGTSIPFYHSFTHDLLGQTSSGGITALYNYYATQISDKADSFGADISAIYHELKRPYSLYNWELGFHSPMLLVDRLLAAQQFDQALNMCHYVLNPYAIGTYSKRFWQFPPFKEIDATHVLENLFLGLQPNQPNSAISEWRDKPFQPHVVARQRPSAYMKWVAMKYIEILIAYGDYYFRQNTLETIPLAIQCYVLASHVYGPRGQKIPKRGNTLPQTYNSLLDKWDAFGNAMVELELAFPFSNQTPLPIGASNGVVGLANVFGFATTLYFCIPDNPQLRALRDTIDDRLFKIRHCEDINGVFRQLPLFEPPIDPALLVQAAAQGISLSSVLNDLNSPMPNYRFYYLLQKALELCSEVKSLGNAFISTKEKGDAEALSQLRAKHESSIHNLVMEVKKLQLDESGKALEALQQSRKGPVYRLQHYLKLVGEDLGKVPDGNTDFSELPDTIEQPVDESGLKLISYEKQEMDKASEAAEWQAGIGVVETLSSILHSIPSLGGYVAPFGVGATTTWGGSNMGSANQAVARALQIHGGNLSYQSTNAGRKGSFLRQLQDRVQQANVAGYEIKNIDKQMLTQQIRISIAQQEITNQQKQIDNAQEVEDFLRNKYTNEELYSWMDSQVRTLYHQAYSLAYDLAKRAEKVFRFERGLGTADFIQHGYWDAAYNGLYSGERLYVALKQLEAAYQEKRGHDFELSKSISLRQINPLALIQLKETGTGEFALPEVLFDMDFPGHYQRRIKSVSLRIPCTLGPHTSLNCTLRLLEHKFRINAIAKSKSDYPEQTDQTDDRFSTVNVPISAIAVSSQEDENGVFELNFHDERYLPFEGAGTISKWRLELPDKFRQFDYDTIMDVVMRVRYTSVDGGDKLKTPAADSVQEYIKSIEELSREEGLFAVFDLINDFPNEWYGANHPPVSATERKLTISKLNEKLPIFTKGYSPKNILAKNVYLFVSGTIDAPPTATQGGIDITFSPGEAVGTMQLFVANDIEAAMDDLTITLKIKASNSKPVIDKIWLLERYILAKT